ncbi:MAG: CHAT domain-containing protein [Kiloniellales bacterium]
MQRIDQEIFLGRALTGEECGLRLLERHAKSRSSRLGVFCDGAEFAAGEIITIKVSTVPPSALATDSDWQRGFETDLACAEVQAVRILNDVPAALRRCTMRDGGWPRLVLAATVARQTYLVTGMPTIFPLLEEAVAFLSDERAGGIGGRVGASIARLKAQVGGSFSLIGVQDIAAFEQLRSLGHQYNSAKDYAGAEDAWRRALEIQERLLGGERPSLGDTIAHLALNVSNEGRFDEAERLFQRAESLVRHSLHPDHHPRFLVYRAIHAELKGQYRNALDLVHESVRLRRADETRKDALAHSLFEGARLLVRLEDLEPAKEMALEALELFTDAYGSMHWWLASTYDLLADIGELLGDYGAARNANVKAIEIRQVLFGPSTPLAQSYAQRGSILAADGRLADALEAYRHMAKILRSNREAHDGVEPESIAAYVLIALRQAARETDPKRKASLRAEAFVAGQLVRGGAAAQAIALMAARLASGSAEIADKTRSLQDVRTRLTALRQALAAEMSKPKDRRDRQQEDRLKGEINKQMHAIQAIEAALEAEHPRYYQLISPRPLNPVAVDALLRPDEAVIAFFVAMDATVVFLVRGGKVRVNAVDLSEANLHRVVAELRAGLDWDTNYGVDFDTRLSQKLYETLLGEFAAELADVRHLLIVPSGPLMSLPPGILITKPIDGNPTDYASAAWLIRKHAVSVLPSLHAIKAMRTQMTVPRASRPFIGFGAPKFAGGAQDNTARDALERGCVGAGDGAVRSLVRSLPGVPETEAELQAIAASLGAGAEAVQLGEAASEARVHGAALKDYRVVAFATHGLLPETLACDMEPALALTPLDQDGPAGDGLLVASEIAALQLDAEVALLSACDTAGSDGSLGGESLSGLARAFLYAGARRVLASHWSIFSVPTMRLTTGLFNRVGRFPEDGYAEALRRSQLDLMQDPDMSHPVAWAPFVLIGDGAAPR